jgi:hypothetical protein
MMTRHASIKWRRSEAVAIFSEKQTALVNPAINTWQRKSVVNREI